MAVNTGASEKVDDVDTVRDAVGAPSALSVMSGKGIFLPAEGL